MLLCQIHMLVQASWTQHTCTHDELCSKGHGIDVNKTDEKRTWTAGCDFMKNMNDM